ncbi:CvpA family protein [Maritimibacter sp. DP07]|jgi:membrane protein required for colicin V production|uniref:CvpA family protein n=1 Tax=Maritimibacter harenae TaxID=2606218 RepID=A0A845M6A1_9RHOB|nr:CvpA family protein [Maritimibacter harenae]MZR13003.1 CvpA family protein [Maritimibacter harenae]
MDGFTIVDGIVALVILVSAVLAYSRGFVREGMAIVGWVVAAIVAYLFAPKFVPLIKEIPVLRDFIAESCELSVIASFAGVLALALVVVSLFTPLFSSVVQRSALGGVDQALGFVFGVLRGILLVAVALIVYDNVVTADTIAAVDNSRSAKIFARTTDNLDNQIPEDAPGWIVARYEELVSTCTTPATSE